MTHSHQISSKGSVFNQGLCKITCWPVNSLLTDIWHRNTHYHREPHILRSIITENHTCWEPRKTRWEPGHMHFENYTDSEPHRLRIKQTENHTDSEPYILNTTQTMNLTEWTKQTENHTDKEPYKLRTTQTENQTDWEPQRLGTIYAENHTDIEPNRLNTT